MFKNCTEFYVTRTEGIDDPGTLSLHIHFQNKLYDVLAPLTPNNKENKVILPLNYFIKFEIRSLLDLNKTLLTVSFNSNLLQGLKAGWLPLFQLPTEISEVPSDTKCPKIFIHVFNSTNFLPSIEAYKEPSTEDGEELKSYYHELIEAKNNKISRLLNKIDEERSLERVDNLDLDAVEISLNVFSQRNGMEGMFIKCKGNIYRYCGYFVEVIIKDNYLMCRTEEGLSYIEEFIGRSCARALRELAGTKADHRCANSGNSSISSSPLVSSVKFSGLKSQNKLRLKQH